MKIHISEATKALLPENDYSIVERGKIEVKGKGVMKTYFVLNKKDANGEAVICPFMKLMEEYKRLNGDVQEEVIPKDEKHAGFIANNHNSSRFIFELKENILINRKINIFFSIVSR
jgi:hypothetical protein